MRIFTTHYDGGADSGVTGYYLIECKMLFSILFLKFEPNHRENLHSHAFNAMTWWLKGEAKESFKDKTSIIWKPSFIPKFTSKHNLHKYSVNKTSWALTFRGPWSKTWKEYNPTLKKYIILTHGRKVLNETP